MTICYQVKIYRVGSKDFQYMMFEELEHAWDGFIFEVVARWRIKKKVKCVCKDPLEDTMAAWSFAATVV